jgi:hypothetical protein
MPQTGSLQIAYSCAVSIIVNACHACLVNIGLLDFHEQHVCVKFCFKLGNTFSDTFEILKQAFGEEAMSRTQTHE